MEKLFKLRVRLVDPKLAKEIGHRLSYNDESRRLEITGEIDDYAFSPRRKVYIPIKTKIYDRRKAKAEMVDALKLGLANYLLSKKGYKVEWRGFLALWQAAIDSDLLSTAEGLPKIIAVGISRWQISHFLNIASAIAHSVKEPDADENCGVCKYYAKRLEASVLSMRDWHLKHRRPR